MSLTSFLFRIARLSADFRSVSQSAKAGSPVPLIRRGTNKLLGRKLISKAWWKG